jgi:hypothetical protein
MKLSKRGNSALLFCAMLFSSAVLAVTPDEDEKGACKKPKFRDFVPEQKAEVAAESEISFHVSHNADPLTVTADVRGEKMKVNLQDRVTFFLAKTKLPALSPGFARIHVTAMAAEGKAIEGGCLGQDGWLIKIKGEESAAAPTQPATPAQP